MKSLSRASPKLLRSRSQHSISNSIVSQGTRQGWICQRCSLRIQTARQLSSPNPPSVSSIRSLSRAAPLSLRSTGTPTTTLHRSISAKSSDGQIGVREDLPSQREGRRSNIAKRFSGVMDHLQSNIFIAGQRLNDLTGYSGIEALKQDIELQGWSAGIGHGQF